MDCDGWVLLVNEWYEPPASGASLARVPFAPRKGRAGFAGLELKYQARRVRIEA